MHVAVFARRRNEDASLLLPIGFGILLTSLLFMCVGL